MSSLEKKFNELSMHAFRGEISEFNELFSEFLSFKVGKNYLMSKRNEITDLIRVDIPFAIENLNPSEPSEYEKKALMQYAGCEKLLLEISGNLSRSQKFYNSIFR